MGEEILVGESNRSRSIDFISENRRNSFQLNVSEINLLKGRLTFAILLFIMKFQTFPAESI